MRIPVSIRVVLGALALLVACSGPDAVDESWAEDACLKHEDCRSNEACVLGECVAGALDEPTDVSDVLAQQWFTYEDGSCSYDNECGPWMCFAEVCVEPERASRPMLPRRDYRYWDTSCYLADDCGAWICADGWCTQPGFVSPSAVLAPHSDPETGTSCLGDNECPEGADCVFPGICRPLAAAEQMTFAELGGLTWYADSDGACASDSECGPHACVDGFCVAQELADRPRPVRRDFFYYDASCSTDDHCGSWVCIDGWCNDPAYP